MLKETYTIGVEEKCTRNACTVIRMQLHFVAKAELQRICKESMTRVCTWSRCILVSGLPEGNYNKMVSSGRPGKVKFQSTLTHPWGAIHELLNIILKLRILVLLPVSTLPFVVKVKNCS
jgi:hypothetical protein